MMYVITQAVDEDLTHEEIENSDESSVGEDTSLVHKQKGKVL